MEFGRDQHSLETLDPVWSKLADKYKIKERLGSGSFGVVVSATHI